MAVKIGHASIDENGHATGGKDGDNNGREICFRNYAVGWKTWDYVIRCKDPGMAERQALNCEAIVKNDNFGYNQNKRNTAHTKAKAVKYDFAKVNKPCSTDCSAMMVLCSIGAGADELEYTGNAPTTATMKTAYGKSDKFEILTDRKYLVNDDYLKRGDILVSKSQGHTAMALEDGAKANGSSEPSVPVQPQPVDVLPGYAKNYDRTLIGTYKTTANLNMRTNAGTQYGLVGTFPVGSRLTCSGYYNIDSSGVKWLYVYGALNGKTLSGYCKKTYLKK